MYDFGNKYDDDKGLNMYKKHVWIVFTDISKSAKERRKTQIHLGMFFNEVGTSFSELPNSKFTDAINSLSTGLYKLPST
jgi:hypothetical protein